MNHLSVTVYQEQTSPFQIKAAPPADLSGKWSSVAKAEQKQNLFSNRGKGFCNKKII